MGWAVHLELKTPATPKGEVICDLGWVLKDFLDDWQEKRELSFCRREPRYFPKDSLGGSLIKACVCVCVCV